MELPQYVIAKIQQGFGKQKLGNMWYGVVQ